MMKIRTMFSVASLCILLILCACSVATNNLETEMEVHSEINSLSDEKFSHIGTTGLNDASKEDFRKFSFTFLLEGPEEISNIKVAIPDFKKTIDSIDGKRYWYGEGSGEENNQKITREFVFYSKGLTNEQIKAAFKSVEVNAKWKTINKEEKEKTINLEDILKFR